MEKFKKVLEYLLISLFILLPILSTRMFYSSLSTLLILGIISIIFILFFVLDIKNYKTNLKLIIPYLIVVIVYFIFHHINNISFNSVSSDNFNYSLIKELLYIIKMICPFIFIYTLNRIKPNDITYDRIINITVLLLGITIIVSNLFMFSYGSYSNALIKDNFLSWLNSKHSYYDLASIGLFYSANQIGAILLLLLPFTLFKVMQKISVLNLLVLIINIFSMFLIGTKTSTIGVVIVFTIVLLLYFFLLIIKKTDKLNIKNIILVLFILGLYILMIPYSPIINRKEVQEEIENEDKVISLLVVDNNYTNHELTKEEKILYIKENYEEKRLHEYFIMDYYPYEKDPDFWYDILKLPTKYIVDYRFLEQAMVKRVIEINNNKYDKYLGIGYSRIQNIFNIERDFVMQYYSLGLIGVIIFLGVYIYYVLKIGILILKNKLNVSIISYLSLFASSLILLISYYSGNLLNSLMVTPYICLIISYGHKHIDKIRASID